MATDAEKASTPQDFSWAGLAAATGAAGLGGFIFDRYIRGNKNLRKNLAMAAGFGAGGALASTAYQFISERNRVAENKKALEEAGKSGAKSATVTSAEGTTQKVDPKTGKELPPPKTAVRKAEDAVNRHPILMRAPEGVAGTIVAHETYKGIKNAKEGIREATTAGQKLVQKLDKSKDIVPLTDTDKVTLRRAGFKPKAVAEAAAKGNINITDPKTVKTAKEAVVRTHKALREVNQKIKNATPAPTIAGPGAPVTAPAVSPELLKEQAAAAKAYNKAVSTLKAARTPNKSNVVLNPALKSKTKGLRDTLQYLKGAIFGAPGKAAKTVEKSKDAVKSAGKAKGGLLSGKSLASMGFGLGWELGLQGAKHNVYSRAAKKIQEAIK